MLMKVEFGVFGCRRWDFNEIFLYLEIRDPHKMKLNFILEFGISTFCLNTPELCSSIKLSGDNLCVNEREKEEIDLHK